MAIYVNYSPQSIIGKALFNFDEFQINNFKYTGTVSLSVSDSFIYSHYLLAYPYLSGDVYTGLASGSGGWTQQQLANIKSIADTFSKFASIQFSNVSNYSGYTPANVGSYSDINISLIYRTDLNFSGESAIALDSSFGYAYGRGDIVINVNGLGQFGLLNDYTFDSSSFGYHALMHEIGHSLGLSHPHKIYTDF